MSKPPRILVTRSPRQASALADRLRALGAEPVLIPTIEIAAPSSFEALDVAIAQLSRVASSDAREDGSFHWVIFTSANAVEVFGKRCAPQTKPDASRFRVAAIGAATARAVGALGLSVDLLPPQAVAESLAEALLAHARQPDGSATRFLLVRAEEAREHLPDALRAAGAEVTVAAAYRNVVPAASIDALRELLGAPANVPDAITFTSASTVRNFFALLAAADVSLAKDVVLASIGPVTSAALREVGYEPHFEAGEATVDCLAEGVVSCLAKEPYLRG